MVTAGVPRSVISPVFLSPMELPVLLEIATTSKRSQSEDSFCPLQTPTSAGDIQTIADEVTASALNDTGADRQAVAEDPVVS